MEKKTYYQELDWMRAIAIALVPITHASYNEIFSSNTIIAYSDIFAHLAVPIFVFISGFLCFKQSAKKILLRIPRILLPYLLLSILCQVVKFRSDILGNLPVILYNLLTVDSFGIYYFVFVIIYLYLFAILLNKFADKIKWILMLVILISIPFFVWSSVKDNNLYLISRELYYRFPLNWLLFFVLGMWFKSLKDVSRLMTFKKQILLIFILSIIILIIANELGYWVIYGSIFWALMSVSGIFALYSNFYQKKPIKAVRYLSEVSYSIYLLHILPIAFMFYFVNLSDNTIKTYPILITFIMFVIVMFFSILVREITKLIFKSKSKFLVGS